MLDNRIHTFITLCETMNFTKTASILSITQPAVSQHIKYLENKYGCQLFYHVGKKLLITEKGMILKEYALSMIYNNNKIFQFMNLKEDVNRILRIGATKTIGEYTIVSKIKNYLNKYINNDISLIIDNTSSLLNMLDNGELDFALIEGYFNKSKYDYKVYKTDEFIGICSSNHRLGYKTIPIEELQTERLIIREKGSGSRAILEQILSEYNYDLGLFSNVSEINSNGVIKEIVASGLGISFIYKSGVKDELKAKKLKTFNIHRSIVFHEFSYVYLKNNLFERDFQDFFNI
ncbi:LysR substrate-binding domain-containing protein [Fusobacterium sp. PH5-44]|uniref:LysR substrate-binding domain-containing protein n=1 Tax=unclassified Fusobacterium TaxID=2648384 RepID=UPI003D2412CA